MQGPARKRLFDRSAPPLPTGWPLALAILFGLQAVFYTIDGWDGIIYFGEEVRNPGRDIPRAIFGSVATIMGIYLLINTAVLYVLPMSQIAGNTFVLGTAAERIFGALRRYHHSQHHGHFAIELPQRQSTFLFAHTVCDELRPFILPQLHAGQPGGVLQLFICC